MTETALSDQLIFLCALADIPENRGLRISIPDYKPVAVFKHDDGVAVVDDRCTHGNASLCDGEVDGRDIECPLHAGSFDLVTGEPTSAPCTIPLRVYKTRISGDKLYMVPDNV
ncbi:MAG: non-heme iron oxygenase ferredoxin subunit [Gammaproteobacteria bacterium]|nr:non-heme iron oxygenase ferredoxin subunit [Gammaproteobacteria bacterium]